MTETARLALPLLEPGQAQKELFHNEALLLLDAAVHAVVATVGRDAPPVGTPAIGTCHATGPAPTDAWAGHPLAIAVWTAGGWRFVPGIEGMSAWDRSTGMLVRLKSAVWRRGAAITAPTGGASIDAQARATIDLLLATLRGHGLLAA